MYGFAEVPSPNEKAEVYQRVLNASWPPVPVAVALPEARQPIDVWARIEWERDGEQWVHARAVKWNQKHVKVAISDERMQVHWTWLQPADVRRR